MRLTRDLHAILKRLAYRLVPHALEERLHDADLDVRLEQAQTNFAERGLDVRFGELGEPREPVPSLAKSSGDRVEHGIPYLARLSPMQG